MSQQVVNRVSEMFGAKVLAKDAFRGDDEITVASEEWKAMATFLRDDPRCRMNQFVDLTAADYPERMPEQPRFDVLLMLRSLEYGHRVRLKTRCSENDSLDSLTQIWLGANWAEREIYDMFGIRFEGHPDLRRILLYEEFEGFPLRKDYPIDRTQPLIEYRQSVGKLAPFGPEEGQPWNRIDWLKRLKGEDRQVSPAIGLNQGQRRSLSDPLAQEIRTVSVRSDEEKGF